MFAVYNSYIDYIKNRFDIKTFKQDRNYTAILEHVSIDYGYQYYSILKNECNMSDVVIEDFCKQNDVLGNPVKFNIKNIVCSPTSLRYLYHAYKVINSVNNKNIVEVGGGYGGLCLAINYLSSIYNVKIKSYTIIDIEDVNRIQSMYLKSFPIDYDINFISASNYKDKLEYNDYFLISNYCISEVEEHHRINYVKYLFPRVKEGFITWNFIPFNPYMFVNFNVSTEIEKPLTGNGNIFVTFNRT